METKVGPDDTKVAWSETKTDRDDSIGTLWTDFTQNTGFHGVNKLTPGRNYKFRCFWWTLAVMGMTAYMTYNIVNELMNFYSFPTVTSMKVEQVEEITFPAVTICNLSPLHRWKIMTVDPEIEYFINKTSSLGFVTGPIDWEKQFLGPTFRDSRSWEWWLSISINPDEIYDYCFMQGEFYKPCTKTMKLVVTSNGLCATFNYNSSDVRKVNLPGSEDNLKLYIDTRQHDYVLGHESGVGVRVLLHEPHVHPDAATTSFMATPGTSTYAVIKKSTFKYLPPPFTAFANRTCLDTRAEGFNNTLEFFDTYTYEHCVLECVTKLVYKNCGCSRYNDHESLEPRCSLFELATCYAPKYVHFRKNTTVLESCGCKMTCSFDKYDVKLSTIKYPSDILDDFIFEYLKLPKDYMRHNYMEIRLYYEELMVQSTEQIPQYKTETIIGNLGGQMGICLGASILTLTELGEFIFIVCMTCFRRITRGAKVQQLRTPN